MAKLERYPQAAPRLSWRVLAGLFDEAWQRERRRRRRLLEAGLVLVAAGALGAALTGGGGGKPTGPGANLASRAEPDGAAGGHGLPVPTHVGFITQAVNKPIPVGATRTFTIQLLDRSDRPVTRAGISVYLGQIIWTPTGPTHASAIIDDRRVGHMDIVRTNAHGVATFAITGTRASTQPTALRAFLRDKHDSNYGSSGNLDITFSESK